MLNDNTMAFTGKKFVLVKGYDAHLKQFIVEDLLNNRLQVPQERLFMVHIPTEVEHDIKITFSQ